MGVADICRVLDVNTRRCAYVSAVAMRLREGLKLTNDSSLLKKGLAIV